MATHSVQERGEWGNTKVNMHCRDHILTNLKYLLTLPGFLMSAILMGQGYPCDGSFYYVVTTQRQGSELYRMVIDPTSQTFVSEQLPLENPNQRHITCLGYNVKDQRLYGLDFNSYELIRIDGNGAMVSLGVPDNLDTSFVYYAGEMTPDGRRLVIIARNPSNGIDERIYSVRVNNGPDYYAGFFSVISELPTTMSDITVDPRVGVTYGFDLQNRQILETDRTGLTSGSHRQFEKVSQDFGSLFFDRQGTMYGFGSAGQGGDHNTLYQISKFDGSTEEWGSTSGGFDSDGCGCPYTVHLQKSVDPPEIVGCNQVRLQYRATNRAGIGQVSMHLSDMLPSQFKIIDIQMENIFLVDVSTSIGTNHLQVDGWTLLLGDNEVTVTVDINEREAMLIGTQAELSNLPLALGQVILSDDPTTTILGDPTMLRILDPATQELEHHWWSSCDQDTIFLSLPMQGAYRWSDGSVLPVLPVVRNGTYSVTVNGTCFDFEDTINLTFEDDPLYVDIGPDRQQTLGDEVHLTFTTNAKSVHSVQWSSDIDMGITCHDCQEASFVAIKDAVIQVMLSDDRGCTATDFLVLRVDQSKEVFVPTAFSPNGDGINDLLLIQGRAGIVKYFRIFNRWGQQILILRDRDLEASEVAWNGMIDDDQAGTGIYIWQASVLFPDGQIRQFAGDFILIR